MHAEANSTVKVHYTGKLDDGTVFDSSLERDPLEIQLGSGQIIPGFERAVTGMAVGETKTFTIESADAYGPHRQELMLQIPRTEVPAEIELEHGSLLQLRSPEGETMPAKVVDLSDESVTLDANHPLAGQTLHFDIELVAVS